MAIVLNGTSGITNDSGYTGDGVSFADSTPANTLVTTSGGNVGIRTASPSAPVTVGRVDSSNEGGQIDLCRASDNASAWGIDVFGNTSTPSLRFVDNTAAATRMSIDSSGNLLVGTTSQFTDGGFISVNFGASGNGIGLQCSTSGDRSPITFRNSNGLVGRISTSGSATSYLTSSDYRLKHDIAPMTGALARVSALKPCTYKWNADDSDGEGFIAHELAEVVPQCVTGEKDAVDADGTPVYQGIDTSFLVATLTAAIQEQQAIINAQQAALESLTARVVALEGQA